MISHHEPYPSPVAIRLDMDSSIGRLARVLGRVIHEIEENLLDDALVRREFVLRCAGIDLYVALHISLLGSLL
jgi:hypothetical protein